MNVTKMSNEHLLDKFMDTHNISTEQLIGEALAFLANVCIDCISESDEDIDGVKYVLIGSNINEEITVHITKNKRIEKNELN